MTPICLDFDETIQILIKIMTAKTNFIMIQTLAENNLESLDYLK
jgi:hypothetical protein